MEKIEDNILKRLSEKGRGRIFFAQEYYDFWPESSVRFALSNLARDGHIARLARGVFCFPELSEYGMKMLLPGTDEIARAVADNSHVRIVPCGDQAAYLVGLTAFQLGSSSYSINFVSMVTPSSSASGIRKWRIYSSPFFVTLVKA